MAYWTTGNLELAWSLTNQSNTTNFKNLYGGVVFILGFKN